MSYFDIFVAAITTGCALFVMVRAVCMLNYMTPQTPRFVFVWYWADAAGAALVIALPVIDMRMPTLAESVFVVGCAIAFAFDKRQKRQTPRADRGVPT